MSYDQNILIGITFSPTGLTPIPMNCRLWINYNKIISYLYRSWAEERAQPSLQSSLSVLTNIECMFGLFSRSFDRFEDILSYYSSINSIGSPIQWQTLWCQMSSHCLMNSRAKRSQNILIIHSVIIWSIISMNGVSERNIQLRAPPPLWSTVCSDALFVANDVCLNASNVRQTLPAIVWRVLCLTLVALTDTQWQLDSDSDQRRCH